MDADYQKCQEQYVQQETVKEADAEVWTDRLLVEGLRANGIGAESEMRQDYFWSMTILLML